MTFSVIYVTADTLQVKPVYVTLRNPIKLTDHGIRAPVLTMSNLNWITQSWMWYVNRLYHGVLMYCFDNFVTVL